MHDAGGKLDNMPTQYEQIEDQECPKKRVGPSVFNNDWTKRFSGTNVKECDVDQAAQMLPEQTLPEASSNLIFGGYFRCWRIEWLGNLI